MKTMILYQYPEMYFFEIIKKDMRPVFRMTASGWKFTFYKILRELKFPLIHFFYGKWKKELNTVDRVIIFDLGYQPNLEKYILKKNPNIEVYLYNWNPIDNDRSIMKINCFKPQKNIYSTDFNDCKKYNLQFENIFYSTKWVQRYKSISQDSMKVWFCGYEKGRGEQLKRWDNILKEQGCSTEIRIVGEKDASLSYNDLIQTARLSYDEFCKKIAESGILLDINQVSSTAFTMRVVEALFFQKKLITDNKNICNAPFYNSNNIFVFSSKTDNIEELLCTWLKKPFIPYTITHQEVYDYPNWVENFGK